MSSKEDIIKRFITSYYEINVNDINTDNEYTNIYDEIKNIIDSNNILDSNNIIDYQKTFLEFYIGKYKDYKNPTYIKFYVALPGIILFPLLDYFNNSIKIKKTEINYPETFNNNSDIEKSNYKWYPGQGNNNKDTINGSGTLILPDGNKIIGTWNNYSIRYPYRIKINDNEYYVIDEEKIVNYDVIKTIEIFFNSLEKNFDKNQLTNNFISSNLSDVGRIFFNEINFNYRNFRDFINEKIKIYSKEYKNMFKNSEINEDDNEKIKDYKIILSDLKNNIENSAKKEEEAYKKDYYLRSESIKKVHFLRFLYELYDYYNPNNDETINELCKNLKNKIDNETKKSLLFYSLKKQNINKKIYYPYILTPFIYDELRIFLNINKNRISTNKSLLSFFGNKKSTSNYSKGIELLNREGKTININNIISNLNEIQQQSQKQPPQLSPQQPQKQKLQNLENIMKNIYQLCYSIIYYCPQFDHKYEENSVFIYQLKIENKYNINELSNITRYIQVFLDNLKSIIL